jgi:MerR family transcriptional regulator, copper efflux regulator
MARSEDQQGGCVMKIGQFAKLFDVTPRTIRYYESLGLIKPCGRTEGGFRLYSLDEAGLLLSISSFKELGLSLEDICRFARKGADHPPSSQMYGAVLKELERCEKEVEEKIDTLRRSREEIGKAKELLLSCRGCENKVFDECCVACWSERGGVPRLLQVLARCNGNGTFSPDEGEPAAKRARPARRASLADSGVKKT